MRTEVAAMLKSPRLRSCFLQPRWTSLRPRDRRQLFHTSRPSRVVKPFLLADIGEGIKEVQVIQWFVQPGARVEQFDKLCEVQSDKAAVEITSRFDGIVKKLYYEQEDMAQVGKPLCDIDIQSEISPEDEALIAPAASDSEQTNGTDAQSSPASALEQSASTDADPAPETPLQPNQASEGKHSKLATPAVRGLVKSLSLDISQIRGSGRDGRVLKEDIHAYQQSQSTTGPDKSSLQSSQTPQASPYPNPTSPTTKQTESVITLTAVQLSMYRAMTTSLSIPHFLYSDEIDFTSLHTLRGKLSPQATNSQKLSNLPFIIKAVSITLSEFPLLSARLDVPSSSQQTPRLYTRSQINISLAIDTPHGLLVPVIPNTSSLSILEIAAHISRLRSLALANKLSPQDFQGGTFTVSNIGSVGGTYVSPIVVEGQTGILGVGKVRNEPRYNANGELERRSVGCLSWAADHRVVDGGYVARCGERVRALLEGWEEMFLKGR